MTHIIKLHVTGVVLHVTIHYIIFAKVTE